MTLTTEPLYRAITAACWQVVDRASGHLDDRDETGDGLVPVLCDLVVPQWTVTSTQGVHSERSLYLPTLVVSTGHRRYSGGVESWPAFKQMHSILGMGIWIDEHFDPTPEMVTALNEPLHELWLQWLAKKQPQQPVESFGIMTSGRCAALMLREMLVAQCPRLDTFLPQRAPESP